MSSISNYSAFRVLIKLDGPTGEDFVESGLLVMRFPLSRSAATLSNVHRASIEKRDRSTGKTFVNGKVESKNKEKQKMQKP